MMHIGMFWYMCHGQKSRFFGDGRPPTFNRNPYNGYINPYYWVDDHPWEFRPYVANMGPCLYISLFDPSNVSGFYLKY